MKVQSFLAFIFTLFALLLVLAGGIWYLYKEKPAPYCDSCSIELELEENDIELEPCKGRLVKLSIKNIGLEDVYKISLEGPDWIIAKPDEVRIKSNEIKDISIYISPPIDIKGEFEIKVIVKSNCLVKEKIISVKI